MPAASAPASRASCMPRAAWAGRVSASASVSGGASARDSRRAFSAASPRAKAAMSAGAIASAAGAAPAWANTGPATGIARSADRARMAERVVDRRLICFLLGGREGPGAPMFTSGGGSGRRLRAGRALELDDVAVRIAQVQGGPFALGAEVQAGRAQRLQAVPRQVGEDRRLVEGLDAQADMVDVAALFAGAGATAPAQRAIQADQVDHRGAGTQVQHAQVRPLAFDPAAQHPGVEAPAALQVGNPEHDMIEALDDEGNHRRRIISLRLLAG